MADLLFYHCCSSVIITKHLYKVDTSLFEIKFIKSCADYGTHRKFVFLKNEATQISIDISLISING